jgi:hypothetical protein
VVEATGPDRDADLAAELGEEVMAAVGWGEKEVAVGVLGFGRSYVAAVVVELQPSPSVPWRGSGRLRGCQPWLQLGETETKVEEDREMQVEDDTSKTKVEEDREMQVEDDTSVLGSGSDD